MYNFCYNKLINFQFLKKILSSEKKYSRCISVLAAAALLLFMSAGAFAAVIPGEGVPHLVDTPDGTIETTENVYNTSVAPSTAGEDNSGISFDNDMPSSSGSSRQASKKTDGVPEVPNFDSSVDQENVREKKAKKSNTSSIVIGLLILAVGGAGIAYAAKSRKD